MAQTSGVLQGSVLELVPFNISFSGLEEGIKCSLVRFAHDTKLGRISQHAKGLGCQRDLDRLKLEKDKCKALGRRNHLQQYKLVSGWQGSSSAEKKRGISVSSKPNMSQQCPLVGGQRWPTASWAVLTRA